ncbi:pantetheine-phosphate adenylyltransferase [Chloroflexota bacterium]
MIHALYPGTFDPATFGHVDIANRARGLFSKLTIAVYETPPTKNILFSTEERLDMMKKAVLHLDNVDVISYSCLTIELAKKLGAKVLIRGLRMGSDFDYEFELSLMNRKMAPELDTVCLMTSQEYEFVSSSLIKEAAKLGGALREFVPEHVAAALKEKYNQRG